LYAATGAPVWAAVARIGAWINLFNLTPVWQLDGGRAFNSLSRRQRAMALGVILVALVVTHVHMLLLVAGGAAYRLFLQPAPDRDDDGALMTYAFLVLVLAALEMLPGMAMVM
ncbi:MAG TPA: hypothetical protein VF541_17365, partial [Longimicrobium sp.]